MREIYWYKITDKFEIDDILKIIKKSRDAVLRYHNDSNAVDDFISECATT